MHAQHHIERFNAVIYHIWSIDNDTNNIRGAYLLSLGFKAAQYTRRSCMPVSLVFSNTIGTENLRFYKR